MIFLILTSFPNVVHARLGLLTQHCTVYIDLREYLSYSRFFTGTVFRPILCWGVDWRNARCCCCYVVLSILHCDGPPTPPRHSQSDYTNLWKSGWSQGRSQGRSRVSCLEPTLSINNKRTEIVVSMSVVNCTMYIAYYTISSILLTWLKCHREPSTMTVPIACGSLFDWGKGQSCVLAVSQLWPVCLFHLIVTFRFQWHWHCYVCIV